MHLVFMMERSCMFSKASNMQNNGIQYISSHTKEGSDSKLVYHNNDELLWSRRREKELLMQTHSNKRPCFPTPDRHCLEEMVSYFDSELTDAAKMLL